jgi:hypothetical protein
MMLQKKTTTEQPEHLNTESRDEREKRNWTNEPFSRTSRSVAVTLSRSSTSAREEEDKD